LLVCFQYLLKKVFFKPLFCDELLAENCKALLRDINYFRELEK
jgi:hypothetical protein